MSVSSDIDEATGHAKPTTGGGRPQAYRTKKGKKVPGVTTVLNRFKESGGLIHWAWQCGLDGIDYRQKRDDAGSVGHYVHALVDADIHGRPPPSRPVGMSDEDEKRARKAHEAFVSWRDQVKFSIIDTESPFVCDLYEYGGTRDAVARVNGMTLLGDWKSSNAVYREHIVQCAAYRHLARKQGHSIDGAFLLRFGKEFGNFEYHYWPSEVLDVGWDVWLSALDLYNKDLRLKGIMK